MRYYNARENLTEEFTLDELLPSASRGPKGSSSGLDGLPYGIWKLVFNRPSAKVLVCKIYNDALNRGVFPTSWTETVIRLLPKKGDLSQLRD